MKKVKRFPQIDGSLGWFETSNIPRRKPEVSLSENSHFDFVIVGAGFTGLSTARRLAELNPDSKIALIDALQVGQGTSGRNAGFIIDLPHNLDSDEPNPDHDRLVRDLNCFAIQRLQETQDRQKDTTHWHRAGKYMGAHEEKNLANLDRFIKTLDTIGADYDILSGENLRKKLGTRYYKRAVYTPGNILMNPAALARSAANDLPSNVDLFENTPLLSIDRDKRVVTHDAGKITAERLILTVNSYNNEFGGARNRIAPIFTYASLTRALTGSEMAVFQGVVPWGLTSAHPAGTTVRLTHDNRIFVRNSFDAQPSLASNPTLLDKAKKQHRKSFVARFPELEDVPFDHSWGGMLCMTMNHQPVFGHAGEGVYEIAAMNGVGVAKGTYLGYYMAELISGRASAQLEFIQQNANPTWVPPEPLKSVGARTRLSIEQRLAKGEV